jgi:hypothetical protein
MTVGMKFQRNVVAKKIGRKWSAKVPNAHQHLSLATRAYYQTSHHRHHDTDLLGTPNTSNFKNVYMKSPKLITPAPTQRKQAKTQAEAKQLRADIQKMAQMNEAASESVAKGEEEMKGGDGTMDPAEDPSEERGDSELMSSIQKSMSHHSDLNLNSEADADADNADLEGAGGEAEHAEGNAEATSLADDLVVVAIMVQLLECKVSKILIKEFQGYVPGG